VERSIFGRLWIKGHTIIRKILSSGLLKPASQRGILLCEACCSQREKRAQYTYIASCPSSCCSTLRIIAGTTAYPFLGHPPPHSCVGDSQRRLNENAHTYIHRTTYSSLETRSLWCPHTSFDLHALPEPSQQPHDAPPPTFAPITPLFLHRLYPLNTHQFEGMI
jgi:hypothetical protein